MIFSFGLHQTATVIHFLSLFHTINSPWPQSIIHPFSGNNWKAGTYFSLVHQNSTTQPQLTPPHTHVSIKQASATAGCAAFSRQVKKQKGKVEKFSGLLKNDHSECNTRNTPFTYFFAYWNLYTFQEPAAMPSSLLQGAPLKAPGDQMPSLWAPVPQAGCRGVGSRAAPAWPCAFSPLHRAWLVFRPPTPAESPGRPHRDT